PATSASSAAIFTVVNGVLLRPLPFDQPERLVRLWQSHPRRNVEQQLVTPPDLVEWRARTQSFERIAYWTGTGDFNLVNHEGSERARCAYVSSDLFATLRVRPYLGRVFVPEEDQEHGPLVTLLAYEYWQRRFGADPQVLGRTLTVDTFGRRSYTIVGVLPPGFNFPNQTEIWLPVGWDGIPRQRRGPWLSVLARLKDGVPPQQAQAELSTLQASLAQQFPESLSGSQALVIPLLEQTLGRNLRLALWLLWGVVAGILLIACANVANLLLARAADRQKEIAIRLALGGSRWRLLRQLLTESLLLALTGGALGVLLARWSLTLLIAFNADHVPRLNEVRLDGWSLGFTLLIACLTGLLFGLAPAWQTTQPDLNLALKDTGKGASGTLQRSRLRSLLVITEVALALLLLVAVSLMLRSFAHMLRVNRGFEPEHLLTAKLDFSVSGFTTWVRDTETRPQVTVRALLERLQQQPGVQSAAAVSDKAGMSITVEGRQTGVESDYPRASFQAVTPAYFRTLGIPLLRGRAVSESDTLLAPRVAILSETLARRLFGDVDPIGKRLHPSRLNPGQVAEPDRYTNVSNWTEIIGIAADVKSLTLDPQIETNAYVPYWQWPMQSPTLAVRTSGNPANLTAALHSEIKALNKGLPAPKVQTMNERLAEVVAEPRFQALLLSLFGVVTLILVSAGLYGVVSYAVAQRTHELGIRMALGASPQAVLKLILGQGLKLAACGIALGLAGALLFTRLLKTLLFGVGTTDPLSFVLAALLLVLVVLLACYLPARRAARVDPLIALRHE
ncbi:MAG: ABC transporter permease, partial [Acidobacteria bacterium]|nr:ABC transporter permease [Acidobacteriota bacterium]